MPRTKILTKKREIVPGICMLIDGGAPCARRVTYRGICGPHLGYLRYHNRIDEFALKHVDRKHRFVLGPPADLGVCRIVDNDAPCHRTATRSGLCPYHLATIKARRDLNLADFVPPGFKQAGSRRAPPSATKYERQKAPLPGRCVIRTRFPGGTWTPCSDPDHARGVCQKHKHQFSKTPGLYARLADPLRKDPVFKLKKHLREGVCVIVEDGVGCERPPTKKRRICDAHYLGLTRTGKLELTDRFLDKRVTLEKKPAEAFVAGFCALVANGVPCTNPVKRRGLCQRCLWVIERDKLDFEGFALPVQERPDPVLARQQRLVPRQCLLLVDGIPCKAVAKIRGLCRNHYRIVHRRRLLEEIALSPEEFRAQAEIPHIYFDKNVVIRFAMHETFHVNPDKSSVVLVEAVLAGRLRASVSLDCVRAVYSHLGHRLARPVDQGGRAMEEKAAERLAREYTGKLFFKRGGLWSLVPLSDATFQACAAEGKLPHLSLEDALEVHTYAWARENLGASMFVTADAAILEYGEAVHPERVATELRHAIGR